MFVKKRWIVLFVVFAVALAAVLSGFALTFYLRSEDGKTALGYGQKENIASLAESLNEIDLSLKKGKYAASPYQAVLLAANVMLEAGSAKESLQHLPITDVRLSETAKYLSQTGEFVMWLAEKSVKGEEITEEDAQTLSSLSQKASALAAEIRDFGGEVAFENYGYDELSAFYAKTDDMTVFERMESLFDGASSVVYDGKYSDIDETEPEFFKEISEMSETEAKEIAAYIMDVDVSGVTLGGEVTQSGIGCYVFEAYNGDRQVTLTKKGGCLFSYMNNFASENISLSEEAALAFAKEFLLRSGFSDMTETVMRYEGDVLIATFVSEKDGVIIYSEAVTVAISLDRGEVVAFTSAPFWQNLKLDRTFPSAVSEDVAATKVSKNLEITKVNRAFALSDGGREYPCYEFICKSASDGEVRVFVNSETGVEERIVLVTESENGRFFS